MEMTRASPFDCHAHIIDPARFPFADGPGYRPKIGEYGTADQYSAVLLDNGMTGALLVQPSCYGIDNSAMLDAIAGSSGRLKGIAVVAMDVSPGELDDLKAAGIVGVRINVGNYDPAFFERRESATVLKRIGDAGLQVEVYALDDAWVRIAQPLRESGTHFIIDHIGHPDPGRGIDQPGFSAVLDLANSDNATIKLSSVFRVSKRPYPHSDVQPFFERAVAAFGTSRCIWGSDWPFVSTAQTVDYGQQFALFRHWLPEPVDQDRILAQNPFRLFGFSRAATVDKPVVSS